MPDLEQRMAGAREPKEEIDLRDYWRVLHERWVVVATCLVVTVLTTLLATLVSTPEYRATTSLQIERQGPEVLTFQDALGVDAVGYKDFYQTQYRILQSRAVLRLAAERVDLVNRPEFLARKGSPLRRLVRWAKALVSGAGKDEPADRAVDFIADGLGVDPVRNSHLVTISFLDRDPDLAAELANAVADAYQQFNLETRYTTTEQASEFLTKEVARLQAEIRERERRLQEYGNEKAILALSDGTQDISEQALGELVARLTEAKSRLAVAQARREALETAPPESLQEVLTSPLIASLKQRYAEVERRHGQMAERFKAGWPELAEVEEDLKRSRQRLEIETRGIAAQVLEVARGEYEQRKAEVAHLEQQVAAQKREVQRVNLDAIEYAGLKAEIDTWRENLSDLLDRQRQNDTSAQLGDARASNIRVIDRAESPDVPARPRKMLNLLMSVVLGAGLGIVMAFVLHHVDNTIKTEQDVERHGAGAPVLGHVPLFEPLRLLKGGHGPQTAAEASQTSPELASHALPRSTYAEAFKNLRTSLLLASPDRPPRHILVTSCGPGDGKTTVTLNLAIVLTQMGRRVLLIDADLRRPRVHKALGVPNDVGLSSYLTGNAELEALLQESGVPDLRVITSGPIPPNPSELLGSPGLEALLEWLHHDEQYDHVLVDSPPAVQVADSLILATKTDATILVVRAGTTARESLTVSATRLRQGRARVAGVVLNAVPEHSRYYYYRYGYSSYHYGARDEPERKRSSIPLFSRRKKNPQQRRAG